MKSTPLHVDILTETVVSIPVRNARHQCSPWQDAVATRVDYDGAHRYEILQKEQYFSHAMQLEEIRRIYLRSLRSLTIIAAGAHRVSTPSDDSIANSNVIPHERNETAREKFVISCRRGFDANKVVTVMRASSSP